MDAGDVRLRDIPRSRGTIANPDPQHDPPFRVPAPLEAGQAREGANPTHPRRYSMNESVYRACGPEYISRHHGPAIESIFLGLQRPQSL